MDYDLTPDALGTHVVYDFFWRFSVFECALKREGFLKSSDDDFAQADWNAFARAIRGEFRSVRKLDFEEAVDYLLAEPPKSQVVVDGHLAWRLVDRRAGISDESYLLLLIRVVRNNLFHGGKYPDGFAREVERDARLLQSALAVLEVCYDLHPGIATWRVAA